MKLSAMHQALAAEQRASTAIEFALVAPVLLTFIFLLVEGGRMEWTQQLLQEVATNTARCMALGQDNCNSTTATQSYAQARSQAWGVSLANATITVTSNQSCGNATGMSKVSIVLPYRSVIGLLPAAPQSLSAVACSPTVN